MIPRLVAVHLDAAARAMADAQDQKDRRRAHQRMLWAVDFGEQLDVPRRDSEAYFEAALARLVVLDLIPGPGAEDPERGLQLPSLMRR